MTDDGDDGMVQKAEPQIERKRLLARSEKVCHQFVRTFAPLAAMTSWLGVVRRDRVGGRFGQNGTGLCWDWQNRPLVTHKHLVQCQGLIGCFVSEKGVERIAFECKVIRSLFQTPQPNTSRPLFAVLGHI